MNRLTNMFAFAGLAALSLSVAACSGAPNDAANGSSEEDVTSATSSIFVSTGPGITDGMAVKLVNKDHTKCADGKSAGVCTVTMLDLGAMHLDDATAKNLQAKFEAGKALVKGTIGMKTMADFSIPALKVTAAWIGVSGHAPSSFDQFYSINDRILNGVCINGGCATVHEQMLNSTLTSDASHVDFSTTGASHAKIDVAEKEMQIGAKGLLVAGINRGIVHQTPTFVVAEFYMPVATGSSHLTCASVDCAHTMHCEMKGINGGAIPVCVNN